MTINKLLKKNSPDLYSSTILIVDDSTISRKKLGQDLAKVGFTNILYAKSAEEALERIETKSPDIFLLDMLMPGINGNELTRKLRQTKKFRHTPIIIVTASDEENLIQESFNNGANDFLRKPWNFYELTARVTSQLERQHAIYAFRESTQRFEQAMEISVDGIWEYNVDTNNIYISPACHTIFNIDPGINNFSLNFFIDLLHKEDRNRTIQLIQKAMINRRDVFEFECRINLADNTHRWISTSAKVVEQFEDSSPKKIIGISKNITSHILTQKHLARYGKDMRDLADERAQIIIHSERLAAIGTMSAGIAHEINNPLSYINGNIQLLKKVIPYISEALKTENSNFSIPDNIKQVAANIPDIINALQEGAGRVSDIIKSMKHFSRKESKANKFITEDITIPIEDALVLCQGTLKKGITVIRNYSRNEFIIPMHPQQITQVLVNLIHNAAQAMNYNGKLFIRVSRNDNEYIKINISDTGPGIPEPILDKIFNPFFTTKGENEGTGIGLSISKTIIKEHRGILKASNNSETGGAEFEIILPEKEIAIEKIEAMPSKTKKIILAEDREIMQQIIMQSLSLYNAEVICVDNEKETIERTKEIKPDALILSMSKSKTIGILSIIDSLIEAELYPNVYVINDINSLNLTDEALTKHINNTNFPVLHAITTQDITQIFNDGF